MPTNKIRILSAAVAAGLVFTGATAVAIANTGHAHTRTAPAADTNSSPTVNLDNCPILAEGYHGGCVNQLQTELNADDGDNLAVDGTFGLMTKKAVERFQQEHNIVPAEGIVGPQTKAALDNPGSSSAGTPPGQLNPGQQITSGTQIASPDGKFVLQMQSDGNLVIRAPGNIPFGDTHTAGHDGTIAVMQTDGNFVLRAPGNIPVWSSGTDGHPGTVLQVQDDGGVVLYAPGHQVLRVLFPAPAPAPSATAPPTPGAGIPGSPVHPYPITFNTSAAAAWASSNVLNIAPDQASDPCAQYVSRSLDAGGLPVDTNSGWYPSADPIYRYMDGFINFPSGESPQWYNVQSLRQYLLSRGWVTQYLIYPGSDVYPVAPGDIILIMNGMDRQQLSMFTSQW